MKNYREYELASQWKPLMIISAILCILSFLSNIAMLIMSPRSIPVYYEGVGVYDVELPNMFRLFLILSLLNLLLYGSGLLFGILIQKRKKTGLYLYTLYLGLRLYLIYNMMMVTGADVLGWVSAVLFIFEAIIILKLWFTEDGKLWLSGENLSAGQSEIQD